MSQSKSDSDLSASVPKPSGEEDSTAMASDGGGGGGGGGSCGSVVPSGGQKAEVVGAETMVAGAAAAAAEDEKKPGDSKWNEDESDEEDDDDDEEAVLESSPCNRYHKRRDQVRYRDVPGIDVAYLAMDSEEGVEVVWNEAKFSSLKKFKAQEANMKNVFDALTLIDHPNIVKFHKYWADVSGDKKETRLIFITEYMSSGSLKQFLKTTKRNNRKVQLQSWKRWCIQILSALNHLHTTCDPPIVHGNLNCDTIFIQHNGLVKIGSVAPDIIQNVKTCKENNLRNLHFFAPEWGEDRSCRGPPIDIYAFGMTALETAALDIQATPPPPNGSGTAPSGVSPLSADGSGAVTGEAILHTIDQLQDPSQQDFVRKCLMTDPSKRPTARSLLFHPVLFEVHSLKLLSAHAYVNTPANENTENVAHEAIEHHCGADTVMATIHKSDGNVREFKLSDFPIGEKLEKFMEDVKSFIYPITAFALSQPTDPKARTGTPEDAAGEGRQPTVDKKADAPEEDDEEEEEEDEEEEASPDDDDDDKKEAQEEEEGTSSESDIIKNSLGFEDAAVRFVTRLKMISALCNIGPPIPKMHEYVVCVSRLEKNMNRQVTTWMSVMDAPMILGASLVKEGIIRTHLVVVYVAMFTRAFIQRAREVDQFWEIFQSFEKGKAEQQGGQYEKQPLPTSLKKYQTWMLDVARNYGFLDDRPEINDHLKPPEGMIWVHDHDYKYARDWMVENHKLLLEAAPPVLHAHPDFYDSPWIHFDKKLSRPQLTPCLQPKPPLESLWPPWNEPTEEFDYPAFQEDTPTKRLLKYLEQQHALHPDEEYAPPQEAQEARETQDAPADLHRLLQAEVQVLHRVYERLHGADDATAEARSRAVAADQSAQIPKAQRLEEAASAHQASVDPQRLQEALLAAASSSNVDLEPHELPPESRYVLMSQQQEQQLQDAVDPPNSHYFQIDPNLRGNERFAALFSQMLQLPRLEDNQHFVVVPLFTGGRQGQPVFLDPTQVPDVQTMALQESIYPEMFKVDQRNSLNAAANLISSPSIDEEISRLQLADSDNDDPHPPADIAAAAATAGMARADSRASGKGN